MIPQPAKLLLFFALTSLSACAAPPAPRHTDDFRSGLKNWVVEQQPGGRVTAENGVLLIEDEGGCTVWFREKLHAPLSISYEATVRADGRVSDLNCFWMASDPANPGDLFHSAHKRNGAFATYDPLRTYYVGYGGNTNSTSRFRRYDGSGARPLLPEHDLTDKKFLLEPGRTYRIELRARDGLVEYLRDGEVLFTYRDPAPLTEGWFGFRTVKSKIEIKNFRID
jgi:Domain of unknown function (DUF6250)